MVIPRSRSISMESSTCSTISRSARPPVDWISRSASVDLPWSMWAMMAKLRMLSIAAFMARGLALVSRGGKRGQPGFLPVAREGSNCNSLCRSHLLLREERLERNRLLRARHDDMAGRHWLPVRAIGIERLRHHNHVAAGLAVVERVGGIVGGVAEGIEVAAVAERRGEAQRFPVSLVADHIGDGREHPRGRPDRILVAAGAEDGEKHRLRIGRPDARAVDLVGDQRLDLAAQARPVADQAVVHEQPAPASEGVAVRPRDRRPGRGAHMREIEMRADVAAQIAQVLVRPGRPDLAIKPGLGMLAVPAHPEAVAVGGGGRFSARWLCTTSEWA